MSDRQKLGLTRIVERALWESADHRKGVRAAMRRELFIELADRSDTLMQDQPPAEMLRYLPPGYFMSDGPVEEVPEAKALAGDEPWEAVEVRLRLVVRKI